jgi:hypothetical protein
MGYNALFAMVQDHLKKNIKGELDDKKKAWWIDLLEGGF